MNGIEATGTAYASVMLARSALRGKSIESRMRAKGGGCIELADRWVEGQTLMEKSRSKTGWFASRASRAEGRAMIAEGFRLKQQAETAFKAQLARSDTGST